MTLRTRLTAAFVVVVLVPLLLVVALAVTLLPVALDQRQEQGLRSGTRLAAAVVAGLCDRARAAAEAAAQAAVASVATDAPLGPELGELVRRGMADGVRVVGPTGSSTAAAGAAPAVPLRDCTTGEPVVTGEQVQVAAVVDLGLPGAVGAPAGSAVAAFTLDEALATRLQQVAGTGEVVLLVDGRPVADSLEGPAVPVPSSLVRAATRSADGSARGEGRFAAVVAARPGQPVDVLLSQQELEPPGLLGLALAAGGIALVFVIGIALVVAGGIAALLARATTRPLGELGDAAARVAAGDLHTTIEVRSRDELGHLAESFNTMTGELRRYVGALEASRDQLQAGVARIGDTLSGTHDLDRILAVVLDTAVAATHATSGAVWLVSPDRSTLELVLGRGLERRKAPLAPRLPFGEGIAGWVARSGEPVRGRAGTGSLLPAEAEPAVTAVLAVPLRSSTAVIGVLTLYDRQDGPDFGDSDLATLRAFTSQATVAVDNLLLHDEARRLSVTDGLTGLGNYRHFTMTVGKEIERASRFGRPLALLLLDLDHFKLVNDVYGHQRGDAVLVELAARVRAQIREVDTVARYGGEEFVVVLPETDGEGAAMAAERIWAAVRRRPFGEPDDAPLDITVSLGVAVFPEHGVSATALLRRADEALYDAKGSGRDTWRLADVAPGG